MSGNVDVLSRFPVDDQLLIAGRAGLASRP